VGSVPSHPVRPVPRRRDAPLGASYAASVIRPLVIAAAVAVFAVAVAVAIEGQTGTDLVARSSVTTAFARVGEPLTVRLDMAQADPGSPVNVIYVPQGLHAPQPPFRGRCLQGGRERRGTRTPRRERCWSWHRSGAAEERTAHLLVLRLGSAARADRRRTQVTLGRFHDPQVARRLSERPSARARPSRARRAASSGPSRRGR
jgi:hypothetical protein